MRLTKIGAMTMFIALTLNTSFAIYYGEFRRCKCLLEGTWIPRVLRESLYGESTIASGAH